MDDVMTVQERNRAQDPMEDFYALRATTKTGMYWKIHVGELRLPDIAATPPCYSRRWAKASVLPAP